ncbi:GT2 family glycosyltransferase [Stella humosa]|uniref:GT2 family glycosyltransferase n=1 Tax=Stella humosa TaxID=94 RepID=A0A3N1L0G3_9PROT|nr:glycosyltransferase [Stella humosa]ROP84430.1 GT2 family glycosyltransferase [Stella humosa]BBK33949.1 hypothetical protein STHU_45830 [Stella humosa]
MVDHAPPTVPRVTVIVTQRERFSLSERSLETVLADRAIAFRLIYVDAGAPPAIAAYLRRRSREAGFLLLHQPAPAWPNHSRIVALRHVETEYVLFLDNDVLLEPGCIAALVACADETGAGIVGPLYLWSDGEERPRIHTAGGALKIVERPAGRAIFEIHTMMNEPVAAMDGRTAPEPCQFLEYHCLLARTDLAAGAHGIDPDIVCVHEHIDLCLEAARRGLPVMLEPRARIDYLAFADYHLHDLPYFIWRWRREAVESSLAMLSAKWNFLDDREAYSGIRAFCREHVAGKTLVHSAAAFQPAEGDAMPTPVESLAPLIRQLTRLGYPDTGLRSIVFAHDLARDLFDGCYRPCGRPFLNHAVGTAGVLAHFRLRVDIVFAGLLHAAFSHGRLDQDRAPTPAELAARLPGALGRRVILLLHRYHAWQRDPGRLLRSWPDPASLPVAEAEVAAIAIANAIEELASGEITLSAKPAAGAGQIDYLARAAVAMGSASMGQALRRLHAAVASSRLSVRLPIQDSFRLRDGRKVPAAHA